MKFLFKFFFILIFITFSESQDWNTSRKIEFHKFKIPYTPPYLKPVFDPINKIKITRITDYKIFENTYPKHAYSKNQPFNCDSTIIKLETKWLLDGKTYKILEKLPKKFHFSTSIWSHKNPNILYIFRNDGKIISYDIKKRVSKLLIHIKGFDRVTLGPGEGNISLDDKYAALACKKGKDLYIIVINLHKKNIISVKTFKNKWGDSYKPKGFDWVSISPLGKYIVILWNKKIKNKFKSSNVEVYKSKDISFHQTLYDYGNHGDLCLDEKGKEVYVQFAGKGSVNSYYLDKKESKILYKNLEFEIGSSRHISCRNYKKKGWCIITTEKEKLIVTLKLDGSGKLVYITSHNSTQSTYKKSSMGVSDPIGEKIMFTSDLGDKREEVAYEFIAERIKE